MSIGYNKGLSDVIMSHMKCLFDYSKMPKKVHCVDFIVNFDVY